MKTYRMSFADSISHKPEHPERTAKRCISWDTEFRVWLTREAMLAAIRKQGTRPPHYLDWKALQP